MSEELTTSSEDSEVACAGFEQMEEGSLRVFNRALASLGEERLQLLAQAGPEKLRALFDSVLKGGQLDE